MLIIAWEVTAACNLRCEYCRASATEEPDEDELSTEEALHFIDEVAPLSPMIILSGGEPLLRPDIFQLAEYASCKGIRVALATNGILLSPLTVEKIARSSIRRVSISLDGVDPDTHDTSRGRGTYERTLIGIENLRGQVPFQINMTITRRNFHQVEAMMDLAEDLGAVALHLFFLVPTGRGREEELITPGEEEELLRRVASETERRTMEIKVTCAPQYARIAGDGSKKMGSNCLAGTGFVFVSRKGDVCPCGYLPVVVGNVREKSFTDIWETSPVFKELRARDLKGRCGECSYRRVCGGCRARAYAYTGDYLESDPLCPFGED